MKDTISRHKKLTIIIGIILIIIPSILILRKNSSETTNQTINISPRPTTDTPKVSTPVKISPIAETSTSDNGAIYGINRENGNLIEFRDGTQSVIYLGKVSDYNIKNTTAIVLDGSRQSDIIIIDLVSRKQKILTFKSLTPIVSATLSDDVKNIYFLAEFGIDKKIASINSVNIDGSSYKKLGETPAQSIYYLKNNVLVLFEDVHTQDKGTLYFYNIDQNKILLSKPANSYLLSPDTNSLAIKTSVNIEILNTNTLQSKSIKTALSSRYIWRDNKTVYIFENSNAEIDYSVLTTEPLGFISSGLLAKDSSIQAVFGFVNNNLIWQNYREQIMKTEIPQP